MKNVTPKQKQEMDLITLMDKFGSNEKCRAYLEALRFPDGVFCLRCESKKISRIYKRNQFVCDACNYQFSVTVGTIFQDSHLPLQKWFAAIYLMCESRKGISANQMKRTLKVAYKTAWYLCHRIREAVKSDEGILLSGIVEYDETFVGSFHQVSEKHLDRYLDELEFRFNNRNNPYLFRDTLLRLIASDNLEYKELIKK